MKKKNTGVCKNKKTKELDYGTTTYLLHGPLTICGEWNTLLLLFDHSCFSIMEKAMAPHSSTLAWKIPWMEEPGGLQSMRSLGVGHD